MTDYKIILKNSAISKLYYCSITIEYFFIYFVLDTKLLQWTHFAIDTVCLYIGVDSLCNRHSLLI